MSEAALQAGVTLVGGAVHGWADRGDHATTRMNFQAAADAAVAAGCADRIHLTSVQAPSRTNPNMSAASKRTIYGWDGLLATAGT